MTTTFAPPAGPTTGSDPTDVLGRRFAAWFVDVLLSVIVVGGAMALVGEYKDVPDNYDDKTEFCEDLLDANRDFEGNCIAPPVGDRVFLVEYSDSLVYSGVGLAWFVLNLVVLQGITGGSVGKLLAGVRVVDGQGSNAGMGRCLGRSLLWVVDALPGIPLVGGITALTTNGHRRVGDMVAATFVVGTASVGRPVNTPAVSTPPGTQAWGAVPAPHPHQTWPQPAQPGWEDPAPTQPTAWAAPSTQDQPTQAPPMAPAQPGPAQPVEPTPEPAPEEPLGIGAEPEPDAVPDPATPSEPHDDSGVPAGAETPSDGDTASFDPTATVAGAHVPWTSTAPPPPEPAADPTPSAPEPQWDEARGTYIQWNPTTGTWNQWDAASNAWVPISQ